MHGNKALDSTEYLLIIVIMKPLTSKEIILKLRGGGYERTEVLISESSSLLKTRRIEMNCIIKSCFDELIPVISYQLWVNNKVVLSDFDLNKVIEAWDSY